MSVSSDVGVGVGIAASILQLMPAILAIIQQIEALFPQGGLGPEKKAVVMAAVGATTATEQRAVSAVVDATVAVMNKAKKG